MKISPFFILFSNAEGMKDPVTPNWRLDRKQVSEKKARKIAENLELFQKNYKAFNRQKPKKDRTTILEFWNFEMPFLKKIPEKCGGCWLTNDRNFEYEGKGVEFT